MSYSKRHLDQKDDEDVEVEEDGEEEIDEDEDVNIALSHFVKKGKGESSKRLGRKPRWCSKILDDFIDLLLVAMNLRTN